MELLEKEFGFWVDYKEGSLQLIADFSLDPESRLYLAQYLAKLNSYQKIGRYEGSPVFSLYQPPPASAAGVRSLVLRLKRRFEGLRIPATATLALNRACQCECEHCSAHYYNHRDTPELSTSEWKQAIRETIELGVTQLIFLGGEPLLRRDLRELVAFVPKAKAVVTMFTNGEYLSRRVCCDLKEAGLLGAFVSIDSVQPEVHDRLRRRPGLFSKAMEGIANLRRAGLLTAISSYLSPDRLREGVFEAMMEFGKKHEVNEVTFFDAIPTGRWLKEKACLLKPEDRGRIAHLVREFRSRGGYPGISAQSTMTSEFGSAFCFAANTQFYLTSHGEMCPCDFTPFTVGRFPQENIETLWKRMICSVPFNHRAKSCRMQDPEFRKKYLDPIPLNAKFPIRLDEPKDLQAAKPGMPR